VAARTTYRIGDVPSKHSGRPTKIAGRPWHLNSVSDQQPVLVMQKSELLGGLVGRGVLVLTATFLIVSFFIIAPYGGLETRSCAV
jgi:hypothetical protein